MNEIVKNKSKYIIAGVFILSLIAIALLIYVLTRRKGGTGGVTYISQDNTSESARCPYPRKISTSDYEDVVKTTCELDPSCVGYYTNAQEQSWAIATKTDPSVCKDWTYSGYPIYKSKSSGYAINSNPNTDNICGCPYPLGLSSSDSNENAVKQTCDLDPSCAGYYGSANKDLFIATKTDPSKCEDKNDRPTNMITFYKKIPPPPPPKVGTYTEIGNYAPSKNSYSCFHSGAIEGGQKEDEQRVLCDNDDECKGYYFKDPGSAVYTAYDTPENCVDKKTDYAKDYIIFKPKDKDYKSYSTSNIKGNMKCLKRFYAARTSSETGAEDTVKKICNELPNCKGYYKNDKAFIAAKKLPSEVVSDDDGDESGDCFDGNEDSDYETEYPYFMKKEV